ncbi:site-specific integrase [Salegentibacter sp. BDJ18]|uniref:site-specific integrase n=1 Tax=Salegentibacter sp. BDJ18 TaxID=2816376 RepID=UPI001AAE2ED6|nr:site-specific integrase [Salegentibacter sp. BDJ18]MBO2546129.1 site-specific integrase [Salegentibacter sp. BDJ18]
MRTKIVKRSYVNSEGKSLLYLHASKNSIRERIALDIYVNSKDWDPKNARVKGTDMNSRDINLIIENVESKITGIKTMYRLAEKTLSLEKFVEEFNNSIPRIDFLAFMEHQIELEKNTLAAGTIRRHKSILNKLREWKQRIYFTEIDDQLIIKLRSRLRGIGNDQVTIESNMASFKKFVTAAHKAGIRMPLDPCDIKVGSTRGDRTDLKPDEIHRIYRFYSSEFVNPRHKLVAGYFLFSCFTGLRISDVQVLKREHVEQDSFTFNAVKTGKKQWIRKSKKIEAILEEEPRLFVKKVTNEEINRVLKDIANTCGINKRISFHVARHSFATNFLRMGGDVQTLQKLLGHSKITETMIYVHIVEAEACEKIKLMDNLW